MNNFNNKYFLAFQLMLYSTMAAAYFSHFRVCVCVCVCVAYAYAYVSRMRMRLCRVCVCVACAYISNFSLT